MKILLINPSLRPESPIKIVPVGLACIATALNNAGFKPDILDIDLYRYSEEYIDKFLSSNKYDMVGFGTIVSSYRITKNLCRKIKQAIPRTVLVVGNTVATSIPHLLLTHVPEVDIAVIGEGDNTVVDIATSLMNKKSLSNIPGIAFRDNGTVHITGKRSAIPEMKDIPFPDYSLFDFEKYLEVSGLMIGEPLPMPREQLRVMPLNTARGCPYSCTFCAHAFTEYKYRYYPFEMIIKQMKYYQTICGANYLNFWDELTFVSIARTHEFCDVMEREKLNINWDVCTRGNLFTGKDTDLLKRCRDLGAISAFGALESASPEILSAMNKHLKAEEFIEHMNTAREAGLVPHTGVVFGYPQETRETIKQTIEVCRKVGVYPSAGFVLPLPGTLIYKYAMEKGLIKDEEEYLSRIGDRQELHINLTNMSDEQFIGTVTEELIRLKDDLGIPLNDSEVLKTLYYRTPKQKEN